MVDKKEVHIHVTINVPYLSVITLYMCNSIHAMWKKKKKNIYILTHCLILATICILCACLLFCWHSLLIPRRLAGHGSPVTVSRVARSTSTAVNIEIYSYLSWNLSVRPHFKKCQVDYGECNTVAFLVWRNCYLIWGFMYHLCTHSTCDKTRDFWLWTLYNNVLTHLCRMESSTSSLWTSPFPIKGSFHYYHVSEKFLNLMQIE